ncbi:hypothetical protein OQA88_9357 [Cercophora sp. LCS_1]
MAAPTPNSPLRRVYDATVESINNGAKVLDLRDVFSRGLLNEPFPGDKRDKGDNHRQASGPLFATNEKEEVLIKFYVAARELSRVGGIDVDFAKTTISRAYAGEPLQVPSGATGHPARHYIVPLDGLTRKFNDLDVQDDPDGAASPTCSSQTVSDNGGKWGSPDAPPARRHPSRDRVRRGRDKKRSSRLRSPPFHSVTWGPDSPRGEADNESDSSLQAWGGTTPGAWGNMDTTSRSTRKEPRWKTTSFINPFSDLRPFKKLTCPTHERCDLHCDPNAEVVIRAVDICLTPSDSEDEYQGGASNQRNGNEAADGNGDGGGDSDSDDASYSSSDSDSPLPSVAPVRLPLHPDHHLGELEFTMAPRFPAGTYIPERAEPTTISPSSPPFEYNDLDSSTRQIRLIKIKPAIFVADVLDCDIITTSLPEETSDTVPEYDALSYCWSMDDRPPPQRQAVPSTGPRTILINGKQHQIQESLALALHRYRRLGCTYTRRERERWKGKAEYIWADGICIDQSNIAEKTTQVTLMGDIYSRARRVFVDLGFVPDNWIAALHLMKSIEYTTQFATPHGSLIHENLLFGDFEIPPPDHIAWRALGYLMGMPWFKRTWVVQEVALNERDPIVMAGTYCFGFSLFIRALEFCRLQGYMRPLDPAGTWKTTHATKLWQFRVKTRKGLSRLSDFLHSLWDFHATDPRDKVFGFLSLMHPDDRIAPDYSLSTEQVYTAFACRAVENGWTVNVLDVAGLHGRFADSGSLSSWVPDWRVSKGHPKSVSVMREHPYNASEPYAGTSAHSRVVGLGDNPALELGVFVADTIKEMADVFPNPKNKEDRAELDPANGFFEHNRALYRLQYGPSDNDVWDAFARTLLMDDLYTTGKNTILVFSEISDPGAILSQIINDPQKRGLHGREDNSRVWSPIDTFSIQARVSMRGRRFAVTVAGYMTLVPNVSLPGDVVCIIPPGTTPFVLREVPCDNTEGPKRYQLVGDAYVHGMMYGEMLQREDYKLDKVWII